VACFCIKQINVVYLGRRVQIKPSLFKKENIFTDPT
jgi:hypothetical protein